MSETLDYLRTFAAFPFALRRFLARPTLRLAEAQRIVRERMEQREGNFFRMLEGSVYRFPRSPYLPLLRQAGCELSGVRALVRQNGLEGALRALREAGVYVTFEELKGRRPIVRDRLELPVQARDFDNPRARRDFTRQTGGSTGAALNVSVDLDNTAAREANQVINLDAHGLLGAPTAIWAGILPDGGLRKILRGAYAGNTPQRWFSHIGLRDSRYWLKYGLATYYLILWMRLSGLRVPLPEYVKLDQALVIARWAADTVKAHGRCLILMNVSRGVRLCLAALEAGIDLTGVTISGGGEPPTPAKVRQMNRAGARYLPRYGMVEASQMGLGCRNPVDGSDVHLLEDSYVLFTHPYWVEGFGVSVPAFNVTALLPSAAKVMLNAQMDDYGIVEKRNCGCELESYGFTTHLRQIRSYSKLTGEGVSLIGNELLRILDEVLPERFGGSPLDYQLTEEEDDRGLTRLSLAIHPRVDIQNEQAVIDCVLDGLGRSSSMADAARTIWQNARTLQIKRVEPVWTGRGKLLPLHTSRAT